MADSAYAVTKNIIPVFKRQGWAALSDEQRTFNLAISRQRIAVEHAFGMLKTRFQCLKELRINIDNEIGFNRAFLFIKGAVVVNNFLIDQNDEAVFEEEDMDALRAQWAEEAREEDARRTVWEEEHQEPPPPRQSRSQATDASVGPNRGAMREYVMSRCQDIDFGPAYQDEPNV